MSFRSEPGLFLSGRPMPPAGPSRRRPFGHVAVVSISASGSQIAYVPDAAQAEVDEKLAKGPR